MTHETTIAALAARFALNATQAAALEAYVDLLAGWRKANVTALKSRDEIVGTLVGDALSLLDVPALQERAAAAWLDLGAGAGVPGIPLAVALPGATLTLLDSVAKKCELLEAAVKATRLAGRAAVVNARSERFAAAGQPGTPPGPGREAHAVVLARAVAPLPVLVELAAPLLAAGGVLLASKTSRALELEGAAGELAAGLCGLAARPPVPLPRSPLGGAVCAVYEKVGPTPARFPRREGVAVKRPLAG